MRERQRSTDLQEEIVKLSQASSSIRELEQQLNDAKVFCPPKIHQLPIALKNQLHMNLLISLL